MYTGDGVVEGMACLLIMPALLFLAFWYFPEIMSFIYDTVTRRDLLAESEEQRRMEGRLFVSGVDIDENDGTQP